MIGTYVHGTVTNSPGLLQVYTVTIAMIGTYVHRMVTNSPGLLQVYTITIADDRDLCSWDGIYQSRAVTGIYCHY